MTTQPDDLMMNAWKQQFGVALRLVEVITEESRKLREFQLTSAVEAHASAVSMRERVQKAVDLQELSRIQAEWYSANLNRSFGYWREACEGIVRTQACVARCLAEPAGIVQPPEFATSNAALLEMMGGAYKRWLETANQIYAPSPAAARKAA